MARLHEVPEAECFPRDFRMGWPLFELMYELADETGEWTDFLVALKEEESRLRGKSQTICLGGSYMATYFPTTSSEMVRLPPYWISRRLGSALVPSTS